MKKKLIIVTALACAMVLGNAQINTAAAFPFDTRLQTVDNGDGTCTTTVRTTFLGIGIGPQTPIDTFDC